MAQIMCAQEKVDGKQIAPVTVDRLRELYTYDLELGRIISRRTGRPLAGRHRMAAKHRNPYIAHTVYVGNGARATLYEHRIVWALVYGEFPSRHLDHIDGDTLNNRIENLRSACLSVNARNRPRMRTNTSGVNGVYLEGSSGKWVAAAELRIEGRRKRINLGRYADKFDAICARKSFDNRNGFTARHGSPKGGAV